MSKRGKAHQAEVLDVLCRKDGPVSAYGILEDLRQSNPKVAPPTVYRALAALVEHGCAHRLESLNAYIACTCDHQDQVPILSICDDCGAVRESIAPDLTKQLSSVMKASGFSPVRHVIEVHGVCASCSTGRGTQ